MAIQEIFEVKIVLKQGIKTLFHDGWRYFTIPTKVHKTWRDSEGEGTYRFQVGGALKQAYAGTEIEPILNAMDDPEIQPALTITHNEGGNTGQRLMWELVEGQYRYAHYRCQCSVLLHEQLKQLFLSTFVYASQERSLDPPEFFTVRFHVPSGTAELSELGLHRPEDPYLDFARRAAMHTSFNSAFQLEQTGKVRNFYEASSKWMPASRLDSMQEVSDVIYMLYDAVRNQLYVGRADKLVKRLRDHQRRLDPNEPIPEFTHFRYSTIAPEYTDFSYLLENAAIHDCAWLFDMPRTKTYRPSLQSLLPSGTPSGGLNGTRLVNRVDHQTRLRQKKT